MRKSKAPEKIFIESDTDLIKVLKSDISVETAERIARKYLHVVNFSTTNKDELVTKVQLYLKRFAHLDYSERPLFLEQQQIEFKITDLYNSDD